MTKPTLSARFPRFTAAVVAGMFASTAALPLAVAKGPAAAAATKKPDKKTRDDARKAYGEGKSAFEKGDYKGAIEGFKKANELIPSPQAQYWVAKSLDKAGELDEAAAAYQQFLDDPDISKASEDKVTEAKTRVAEIKNAPAEVNVTTTPPGAIVTVDGQAQMGETPMVVKLTPGTHTVELAAPGYDAQKMDLTVKSGEKLQKSVLLKLSDATPLAAPMPPPAAPETPEPAPPPEKKSKVPAYVTLGIAGAGAIVGTIFGVKALSAKKDFDSTPTNDHADTVERNALISDMAFGVAITLGVTGIVLLTSSGSSEAGKDAASLHKLPKRATVNVNVAPYVGLHGGGAAARLTF